MWLERFAEKVMISDSCGRCLSIGPRHNKQGLRKGTREKWKSAFSFRISLHSLRITRTQFATLTSPSRNNTNIITYTIRKFAILRGTSALVQNVYQMPAPIAAQKRLLFFSSGLPSVGQRKRKRKSWQRNSSPGKRSVMRRMCQMDKFAHRCTVHTAQCCCCAAAAAAAAFHKIPIWIAFNWIRRNNLFLEIQIVDNFHWCVDRWALGMWGTTYVHSSRADWMWMCHPRCISRINYRHQCAISSAGITLNENDVRSNAVVVMPHNNNRMWDLCNGLSTLTHGLVFV